MDDNFGRSGHVERFAGPMPDGRHVRERHVQQRRVPAAPPRVVQQKSRVHLRNTRRMVIGSLHRDRRA